jgi:hypothetical protein
VTRVNADRATGSFTVNALDPGIPAIIGERRDCDGAIATAPCRISAAMIARNYFVACNR